MESSFTPTATLAQTQLSSSANGQAAAPVSDAHWHSKHYERNDLPSSLKFMGDDCGCLMLKLCQGRANETSGLVRNQEGMAS